MAIGKGRREGGGATADNYGGHVLVLVVAEAGFVADSTPWHLPVAAGAGFQTGWVLRGGGGGAGGRIGETSTRGRRRRRCGSSSPWLFRRASAGRFFLSYS